MSKACDKCGGTRFKTVRKAFGIKTVFACRNCGMVRTLFPWNSKEVKS